MAIFDVADRRARYPCTSCQLLLGDAKSRSQPDKLGNNVPYLLIDYACRMVPDHQAIYSPAACDAQLDLHAIRRTTDSSRIVGRQDVL